MGIVVKKKISLAYVGEDWKDSYLEFKVPTVKQVNEVASKGEDTEFALNLIKELFIGGLGLNEDGNPIEIKKADLDNLPITLVTDSFRTLVDIDPNFQRT